MNVYITAHRSTYAAQLAKLIERTRAEFPQVRMRVLVAEEDSNRNSEHFTYLIPPHFARELGTTPIDEEQVFQRLMAFADAVPLDLCRSDIRHVVGLRTEAMLALEQAVLSEAVSKAFDEAPPDLVFVSSGTNLLHSVAYHLAAARGAKVYRIHSYLNLNLNLSGQRVWFCSNNRMALGSRPEDKFGYDPQLVSERIEDLHAAIVGRTYRLDEISKRFRTRRIPITLRQFARDVARYLYFISPLQRRARIGRLGANASKDRLRALANAVQNRRLMLSADQLPKRYILFALNTPYDSQILVRAPEYRDFISLMEQVAALMPFGYDLLVREHPAFLGMLDHGRLRSLRRRHPHVKIVSSDVPFPSVVKEATGVIIINNTAFVDAILAGKPTISLGNGYFQGKDLTIEVPQPRDLRAALGDLVRGRFDGDRRSRLADTMGQLFQETFPAPDEHYDDKSLMISEGILLKLRRIHDLYGSFEAFRGSLSSD